MGETLKLLPNVQQRLEQQLLQIEHRTYLWLYLAIDDIRTTFQESLRPAEESIRLVPPSVNVAYERILARVPSSKGDTVQMILSDPCWRTVSFDNTGTGQGLECG